MKAPTGRREVSSSPSQDANQIFFKKKNPTLINEARKAAIVAFKTGENPEAAVAEIAKRKPVLTSGVRLH